MVNGSPSPKRCCSHGEKRRSGRRSGHRHDNRHDKEARIVDSSKAPREPRKRAA